MRGQWPGLERGSVSRGRSQGRTMKLSLPWWSQVRAVGVTMLSEIRAGHTWRQAGQAGVRASQETVRGLECNPNYMLNKKKTFYCLDPVLKVI